MAKLVFCLQTPISTVSWCTGAMLCFSSEMSITDSLLQKEVWPSCRITGASSFAIPEHGTSHSLESTFCAEQTDCISPSPPFSLANSPVSPVDRRRLLTAPSNAGGQELRISNSALTPQPCSNIY